MHSPGARLREGGASLFFRLSFIGAIAFGSLFISADGIATSTFLSTNTLNYTSTPNGWPTVTNEILRDCHTSGICSTTPANQIYIYPIKCAGSGSAMCTGCWRRVGATQVRAGDLDNTNSCPAGQFKIYVGYQMSCPGTSPCTNGKMLLGWSIEKVGASENDNSLLGYKKESFAGAPIVVDATNAPAACGAGQYRDNTDSCVACPAGTYKPTTGDLQSLCMACPSPMVLPGGQGTGTGTSASGSTAASDCSYSSISCDNPVWLPDVPSQTCVAPACSLA